MRFLRLRYFAGAALIAIAIWWWLKPDDWMNWLGFSHDAYFKTGEVYAFMSGIGPVLVGLLGASSILWTLLHHLNCHVDGCPRINKHKVAGGEYGVCTKHWREINGHDEDQKYTVKHIRDHHLLHLRATGRAAPADRVASDGNIS